MGEQEGLNTISVRIGAYQPYSSLKDESLTGLLMNAWLSEPDCVQLLERCIDATPNLKYAVVHGLSRNIFNRMDINSTRQLLGYDPQDNFFETADKYKQLHITDTLLAHNVQ
jgi:uronate dehydrogenase